MDYSKYKFNYFDVIKRHERIINRPKDWEVKVLAIIMLMVTFIYTFTNFGFCSDIEQVDTNVINGLFINNNGNYFTSRSDAHLVYFVGESGYIYHIKNLNNGSSIRFVSSNEVPAVNVTYDWISFIEPQTTYDYIPNSNSSLYLDVSSSDTGSNVLVTREKIPGYSGVVDDLVDNVGVNQIWSVFENGTSFIGVVVLVAFGLFLVVLAIKKISKGKSEF